MRVEVGQLLQDRYRIEALLGKGGMGAVYRAIDTRLDCAVAIKENLEFREEESPEDTLPSPSAYSERRREQFLVEAQLLARLRHPSLPRVTDHFLIRGQGQYLVMEFIGGRSLAEILHSGDPLGPEEAVSIVRAVCDVLDYLHRQDPPVIHRDIKPANIRRTPEGRVFLVDFGIAKQAASAHTQTGAIGVTPGYSPLEQYGGTSHTDARSDIYALGCTLYALLGGETPPAATDRVVGKPLHRLPEKSARVSEALQSVIERAMALKPQDRYQSAVEFREALEPAALNATEVWAPATVRPSGFQSTAAPVPEVPAVRRAPIAREVSEAPEVPSPAGTAAGAAESRESEPFARRTTLSPPTGRERDRGTRRWLLPALAGVVLAAVLITIGLGLWRPGASRDPGLPGSSDVHEPERTAAGAPGEPAGFDGDARPTDATVAAEPMERAADDDRAAEPGRLAEQDRSLEPDRSAEQDRTAGPDRTTGEDRASGIPTEVPGTAADDHAGSRPGEPGARLRSDPSRGESVEAPAAPSSGAPPVAPPSGPPEWAEIRPAAGGAAAFRWTSTSPADVRGFEVHLSETAGFAPGASTLRATSAAQTEANVSGLECGRTYFARIRQWTVDGRAIDSAERSLTTEPCRKTEFVLSGAGDGDEADLVRLLAMIYRQGGDPDAPVTINVRPGAYLLREGVAIGRSLRLRGEGATLRLEGPVGLKIDAPEVELSGMTILASGSTAVVVERGAAVLDHCEVRSEAFSAVEIKKGARLTVRDCVIARAADKGFLVLNGASLEISRTTISGADSGVEVRGESQVKISDSTIEKNRQSGVYLNRDARVELQKCRIRDNGLHGILQATGSTARLRDCTVSGNAGAGLYLEDGAIAYLLGATRDGMGGNKQGKTYEGAGARVITE